MMTIDSIIAGLQIIQEVEPNNWGISAEHDEIYAGGNSHNYTEDQIKRLEELGFHFDEGIECFRVFV